ncbi:MAG: lysostaphin resistance A-like protein [Acidobacteriaceae bacterium]
MKKSRSTLLLILEFVLLLAGLAIYALGYLPFPIIPLFLVAWASLRLRHISWRDVGLRRPDRWLLVIGLGLLIGVSYQLLDIFAIAPILERLTGKPIDLQQFDLLRGNLLALIISLVISWTEAAFIEEMFFRGYLFNRLTDVLGSKRWGIIIALLISSLIFGAGHAYQGVTGLIDTTLAGVVLGLLYLVARRNLWLPILTHGIIDTIGFLLIYARLVG